MILIGSSNWRTFEGDLGDVYWIPSKCGTFGGHLGGDLVNFGVVNWISSNWRTLKGTEVMFITFL